MTDLFYFPEKISSLFFRDIRPVYSMKGRRNPESPPKMLFVLFEMDVSNLWKKSFLFPGYIGSIDVRYCERKQFRLNFY